MDQNHFRLPQEAVNYGTIRYPGQNRGIESGLPTIIMTGLARSGTSMLARAMQIAGVFIGDTADDAVYEDVEISRLLEARDHAGLSALIAARNAENRVWGFKRPHLHEVITPAILRAFRNPHMVVCFRDPIAIAQRNMISEHLPQRQGLEDALRDQQQLTGFVFGSGCPSLLVSYEKAITFPEIFVDQLAGFCGLAVEPERRAEMINSVDPNREAYLKSARRHFEGVVDQIAHGVLSGWARQVDATEPVRLTLFIDHEPVATLDAGLFRPDLAAVGIGEGQHGFLVDIRHFPHRADSVVEVLVEGRTFALRNSGSTIRELADIGERLAR